MTEPSGRSATPVAPAAAVHFAEHHVEAGGFRIRYLDAGGAGQDHPLVYLHGAAGPRLSRAHELLAADRRLIAVEVPGFGESPVNERSRTMADLAGTLHEALAALGLDRVDLLGNSFGGALALWMAVLRPDRVRALVLAAPAAIRPEAPNGEAGPPTDPNVLLAHPERVPPRPPPDPATTDKQLALVRRLIGAPRDPRLLEALPSLDVPALVLFGTDDRAIPPAMGREYRRMLPRCHYVLLYDAGHLLDIERPEAFAAVVADFLREPETFLVHSGSGLLYP